MKKTLLFIISYMLISLIVLLWLGYLRPSPDPLESRIDQAGALIKKHQQEECIPGIQFTLIDQYHIDSSISMGKMNQLNQQKVTDQTLFFAQSMTKTMTAVLILNLVEEGQLKLEDYLYQHIPDHLLDSIPSIYHQQTIEDILTHHALFPLGDFHKMYAFDDPSIPELEQSIIDDLTHMDPKEGFSYSNVGYHLLEIIINYRSGMSYASYARNVIFEPLDLHQSYFTHEDINLDHVAKGYDEFHHEIAPYRYPEQSSGGLLTTSRDYATFLIGLFQGKLLSNDMLDQLIIPSSLQQSVYRFVFDGYGKGIFIDYVNDDILISHGGQGRGYMAYFQLNITDGTGFVMLANSQRSYPLIASLAHLVSNQTEGHLGLYVIRYLQFGSSLLLALLITLSISMIFRFTKKRNLYSSMISSMRLILSTLTLILSIIWMKESYTFLHVLIPREYEHLIMMLYITSLIGIIDALVFSPVLHQKGGEKSAYLT